MKRAAAAAVLLLLLSGCGSVPDRVRAALDSAESATASAAVALQLRDDGTATTPFTDTVLGDALTELDGATSDLTQVGPVGEAAPQRDAALAEIGTATDAVLAARETVAWGGDLASDIAAVEAAARALKDRS